MPRISPPREPFNATTKYHAEYHVKSTHGSLDEILAAAERNGIDLSGVKLKHWLNPTPNGKGGPLGAIWANPKLLSKEVLRDGGGDVIIGLTDFALTGSPKGILRVIVHEKNHVWTKTKFGFTSERLAELAEWKIIFFYRK